MVLVTILVLALSLGFTLNQETNQISGLSVFDLSSGAVGSDQGGEKLYTQFIHLATTTNSELVWGVPTDFGAVDLVSLQLTGTFEGDNVDVFLETPEGEELAGKYMVFASPGIIVNGELFATGGFDRDKFTAKLKELSQKQ